MKAMCPSCFKLYSDIGSNPYCTCTAKTIAISEELVDIVKMLIERGFQITGAKCDTQYKRFESGKVTRIDIDFEAMYPSSLFAELPPNWELTDSYPIIDNQYLGEPFSVLACECEHPSNQCDPESIDLAKKATISNLESWLKNKDPKPAGLN